MKDYCISIDVGGTAIKYGVLNRTGILEEKYRMPTRTENGRTCVPSQILSIVEKLQKGREGALKGIGVSTAGIVDGEQGRIIYAGELIPGYTGTELRRLIEERFRVPCSVENDVNCAGLAEVVSGAAVGCTSAVCLTIGTGIGGCVVLDGKIYRGDGNCAGEIGYMYMDGSDFQTLGASSIMIRKVAEWKKEDPEKWDGIQVFQKATEGDEDCWRAIREMTEILGKGIANICYVLNPQAVVLGGGIMEQQEILQPLILEQMERYLKPVLFRGTRLLFAKHGNDAGMLGAYYVLQSKHPECFVE